MKKKLLIFGKSEFFIKLVKKKYSKYKIYITSWHNPNIFLKFDIIFICGFDYSAYQKDYKSFIKSNYSKPLNYLRKIKKNKTKVIYINTLLGNKNYSFSRYYFVKHLLAKRIIKEFLNNNIINIPTIYNNKNLFIRGDYVSKIIFKLLIKLNFIKTINLNQLNNILNMNNVNYLYKQSKSIKGILLKIPRNIFIDRLLRILIG
jgi:hypothetical protein